MTAVLSIWSVYDHPKDFPDVFVARKWEGTRPTADTITSEDLATLRRKLAERGLICLTRCPDDDPTILETWL